MIVRYWAVRSENSLNNIASYFRLTRSGIWNLEHEQADEVTSKYSFTLPMMPLNSLITGSAFWRVFLSYVRDQKIRCVFILESPLTEDLLCFYNL